MVMHPAVKEMLDLLDARFPGQDELSLDDYAAYRGIGRRDAASDLRRRKIPYVKDGRRMFVLTHDFAVYLAKNKMIDGNPIVPSPEEISQGMKRRRGFCQMAERKQISG